MYSTCTLNPLENEANVAYGVSDLGLKVVSQGERHIGGVGLVVEGLREEDRKLVQVGFFFYFFFIFFFYCIVVIVFWGCYLIFGICFQGSVFFNFNFFFIFFFFIILFFFAFLFWFIFQLHLDVFLSFFGTHFIFIPFFS